MARPPLDSAQHEDPPGSSTPIQPAHQRPPNIAFSSLLLMTLVVALDGTTVAVGLSAIAQALHGTAIEALWTGTAYTLCSTVFQPVFASFSYVLGRKAMILAALCLFALGAILCGISHGFTVMLTGRSLQGIGGAGLIAMTEVVLTDLVPLRQRGTYTGVIASMYALGGGVGPIVGGALAQSAWRWIFWINLPFIGASLVTVVFFLPLQQRTPLKVNEFGRIDWIGSVLFIGGTTTLLLPVSWGGIEQPWESWRTILPLCLGLVTLLAFVAYERRYTSHPLIPSSIFPNLTAIHGYLASGLQGLITYALLYFLPLYLQAVKGFSPLITGCALLSFSAGVAPAAAITGYLITKLGHYRWSIWAGWAISTIGPGLLLLLRPHTAVVELVFLVFINAVGNGMVAPSVQFQVQAAQANQRTVGLALAMYSFTRSLGQTFGIAVGGIVFQNSIQQQLEKISSLASEASQLSRDATTLAAIIKTMPPSPTKMQLVAAYVEALRSVWYLCVAVASLALASSVAVKSFSLDVKDGTIHQLANASDSIELEPRQPRTVL